MTFHINSSRAIMINQDDFEPKENSELEEFDPKDKKKVKEIQKESWIWVDSTFLEKAWHEK